MKKRILVTTMALAMAFTTAMGSMGTLTVYATDDGLDHGDGREPGGSSASDGSDNIGGGSSNSEGSSSSSSGGDSGSSSSSSSGESSSYSEPSYSEPSYNEPSYDSGSSASSDNSASASYSAPAPKAAGTTASVTGKETFRAVANAGGGTYKVIHKGVDIATFTLMDAESKKAVACTKVALKQREDGKWAINYEVADATGLTVGAPLDRTYLYTLGISYISIGDANGDTIVIDIEAEAQAAATK